MNATTQLRQTIIALLDDPNGVNDAGYTNLQTLEATIANGSCNDIFDHVQASDGRFYLPEDHGLVAEVPTTTDGEKKHHFADCGGYPRCVHCGCDEDDVYVGGQECK